MEKRAVAPLVLGGAGLALVVAIAILLVKVRAEPPAASVSPAELAHGGSRVHSPPAPGGQPPSDMRSPPTPRLQSSGEAEPAPEGGTAPEGSGGIRPETGQPGGGSEDPAVIAEKMTEANRLYDRGDYEAANQMAQEVLKVQPQNTKMLRIGTSTACILGDASQARTFYELLPEYDQQQIARRCRRYGVEL